MKVRGGDRRYIIPIPAIRPLGDSAPGPQVLRTRPRDEFRRESRDSIVRYHIPQAPAELLRAQRQRGREEGGPLQPTALARGVLLDPAHLRYSQDVVSFQLKRPDAVSALVHRVRRIDRIRDIARWPLDRIRAQFPDIGMDEAQHVYLQKAGVKILEHLQTTTVRDLAETLQRKRTATTLRVVLMPDGKLTSFDNRRLWVYRFLRARDPEIRLRADVFDYRSVAEDPGVVLGGNSYARTQYLEWMNLEEKLGRYAAIRAQVDCRFTSTDSWDPRGFSSMVRGHRKSLPGIECGWWTRLVYSRPTQTRINEFLEVYERVLGPLERGLRERIEDLQAQFPYLHFSTGEMVLPGTQERRAILSAFPQTWLAAIQLRLAVSRANVPKLQGEWGFALNPTLCVATSAHRLEDVEAWLGRESANFPFRDQGVR